MVVVAVGQICSNANIVQNLKQCRLLVQKAAAYGAKALFLPEAADYIASSASETVSLAQPIDKSEFVKSLRDEARKLRIAVNVGVHEPADGGRKVKNMLIWIDERGEITQRYQKLHLFDVDIPGGPSLRESDSVEAGDKIVPPFDTPIGRVGMAICYDLRFPELSLALKRQHAQIIVYPSAFTVLTGKAHWHTLLRSRAIETQSYVIAAAQVGFHNKKRRSYGHSLIVSPWGEILADIGEKDLELDFNGEPAPELAFVNLDLAEVERIKTEMPLIRRLDVYPEC